jgi:thiamine biosynthesis lipoprotein ApbE
MHSDLWIVPALLLMGSLTGPIATADEFAFYHEEVMGTALELRVRADSEDAAREAEARVLSEIDRLSAILSSYDPSSRLSEWMNHPGEGSSIPGDLFEVLRAADHWRQTTGGAFDPRVAAFGRLWDSSAERGRTPTLDELAEARALASVDAWRLEPGAKTAERIGRTPISLDGIAKGFIIERACAEGFDPSRGVRGILLNVGGDLRVVGEGFGTIGLAPPKGDSEASEPFTFLEARDRSVATSGAAHRGWSIDGRWYSHILDPRIGRPVEAVASASVVAPSGTDADALATALNVLPIAEGLRLVNGLPEVECLIVAFDGTIHRSAGWEHLERPRPASPFLADAREPAATVPTTRPEAERRDDWGEAFELVVRFEINRPEVEQRRYRRPYVVVYIEDETGHVVRHLLMWVSMSGSGPDQWLPDLLRWYRSDAGRTRIERRNKAYAIGRSTRPPGRYSIAWDGKDDGGRPLPRGSYTIFVEAAREHGTHQVIRMPVSIGNEPFAGDYEGNVEIKSAAVEYRRTESE